MKRIIPLLIAVLLLSACGADKAGNTSAEGTAAPETSAASTTSPEAATPTPTPTPTPEVKKLYIINEVMVSEAIKNNLVKESGARSISISLPPSYYDTPEKRYPVIYYLHGHGEPLGALVRKNKEMSRQATEGSSMEFIVVEADCGSMLGGSFYANSPVTGNFEDFYIQELVPYVDSKYRTIAKSSARGITGFSMGGFGAMYLGFRHPDVFSAVLAFGPGLFDKDGVKTAINVWDDNFEANYGAVFSPDTTLPKPYARIPKFDGSEADNQIIADWYNGFGNWEDKIQAYLALPDKLTGVRIVYGTRDGYPFIPAGCVYVSKLLTDNGIPAELSSFDDGHVLPGDYTVKEVLPFFNAHLKAE